MSDVRWSETKWQKWLVEKLQASCGNRELLSTIPVNLVTAESSIGSLCGDFQYSIFEDNSDWNRQRKTSYSRQILMDISGGMTPDIVLRSGVSDENRIYIEVKEQASINYGMYDSQMVRYFLHLLATSKSTKSQPHTDLRRAVILAAPDYWFEKNTSAKYWYDFCERFAGLADAFDVTLGEIRLNDQLLRI
ncbi:hypothetical protein AruPA_17665 [Acidiphilium sp. PA]|uniref:hypothetical protein n=1 Tax=Acidiphilium sp. PA TaxID=2871705 RepID=UPI002242D61E|nr:hypothetical protein [Acidiphilium sp. PA]MCW8308864.1 hypothetical protein [Acidiphilium sp. PA]